MKQATIQQSRQTTRLSGMLLSQHTHAFCSCCLFPKTLAL